MKTSTRVYVNLELSVNEKFVAYGIMVKILANLKSPCSNACYLKQKAKPAIEKVWLRQCFGNKIFLSWFDLRNIIKLKKIIVPYAIHFCCVWDTKSLKPSYLQQVKLWKKKFIAKTVGQIHPPNSRFKFLYQFTTLGTGTLQNCQNLDHYAIHNKFFIYQ